MKKIFLFSFLLACSIGRLSAQRYAVSAGIAYGSDINHAGINAGFYYQFTEVIRGGTNFTIFTADKHKYYDGHIKTTLWEWNLDGHYMVPASDQVILYPLFGLNISGYKIVHDYNIYYNNWKGGYYQPYHWEDSGTEAGINLGAGAEFRISSSVAPFIEVKYVLASWEQAVLGLGVKFMFE